MSRHDTTQHDVTLVDYAKQLAEITAAMREMNVIGGIIESHRTVVRQALERRRKVTLLATRHLADAVLRMERANQEQESGE